MAAARLALLQELEDTHQDVSAFTLPGQRPFGYFSRCAVHPNFRLKGLATLLDKARINFLETHKVRFTLAFCFPDRASALENLGFGRVGDFSYKWGEDTAPCLIYLHKKS